MLFVIQAALSTSTSADYPEIRKQSEGCGIVGNEWNIFDQNETNSKFPWTTVLHMQSELVADEQNAAIVIGPSLVLLNANDFRMEGVKKFRIHPMSSYTVAVGVSAINDLGYHAPAQFSKITQVRFHPKFNYEAWESARHDFALLHLETELNMTQQVRPVCLPLSPCIFESITKASPTTTPKHEKNEKDSPEPVILSGWNRNTQRNIFLRMALKEDEECRARWKAHMIADNLAHAADKYGSRLCGSPTSENTHKNCIYRGIGAVKRHENGAHYLLGVSTCTPSALYYFMTFQQDDLTWIENNMRCGPRNFTCSRGNCIPLTKLCDRVADCADESDEDPMYCRALKPCGVDKFACGIYGQCLDQSMVCNSIRECEDGEDEAEDVCPSTSNLVIYGLSVGSALVVSLLICLSLILLRNLRRAKEKLRDLTPQEIQDFLSPDQSEEPANPESPWIAQPYNTKYEIPSLEMLQIDKSRSGVLGSGAFGKVFKAILKVGRPAKFEIVAVKTFKSSDGGVVEFKALLQELKIQIFVGAHQNILRLIGAYTQEIQTRILYIVLEFCPFGSLEGYLRDNQKQSNNAAKYVNIFEGLKPGGYANAVNSQPLSMEHLIKWSHQIASGMEFLSGKNVTHGDLASRNVLLDVELSAKICDFGLARQLDQSYGVFSKRITGPLPYLWMAPESLHFKRFSLQSDIWSYGVTLWEIFSFGAIPYAGMRWTPEFVHCIEQGMRLEKPPKASMEIYEIMKNCWSLSPEGRPGFQQLAQFFTPQLIGNELESSNISNANSYYLDLDF